MSENRKANNSKQFLSHKSAVLKKNCFYTRPWLVFDHMVSIISCSVLDPHLPLFDLGFLIFTNTVAVALRSSYLEERFIFHEYVRKLTLDEI